MTRKRKTKNKKQKSLIFDITAFALILIAVLAIVITAMINGQGRSNENLTNGNTGNSSLENDNSKNTQTKNIVLEINGEKITKEELNMHIDFVRVDAMAEYNNNNENNNNNNNNEDLESYTRRIAVTELVRYKVEQGVAKKYNLIKNTDYDTFLKDFEEENRTRKEKIENGEIVYGAKEYSLRSYFSYVYSNLKLSLLNKLKGTLPEFSPSDDELKNYYEENKEQFKAVDDYEFLYYETEDKSLAEKIYNDSQSTTQKDFREISINEDTYRALSKENEELYQTAIDMNKGDIELVCINDRYNILICVDRKDAGYRDFDEYKDDVLDNMQREIYEKYIDKLVDGSKVTVY